MSKALPVPGNETERVEALHSLQILDTLPEPIYDSITRLAARICEAPISLISLVDRDRLWFKSRYGLEADELLRDCSICQYTIMGKDMFVVEDTAKDERFSGNPMVRQPPKFRFYAGYPINDRQGHNIGTLCVIDTKPRQLNEEQTAALHDLSEITTQIIISSKTNNDYEVYKKFFAVSLDMLCIAGTDAFFKLLNPAFTRILGWSRKELKERPFLDFVHEEDLDNTLREIDKLAAGEPTIAFRNRYRKKDGSYVWMHWNAMPDEKTGEIFAAASDITDVVEAKEQLERALQYKDIFLSNVSHEIRTPMNAIRGFAELLQSSSLDETQKEYLDTIILASDNLLVLINDILDMSKIQSGKIHLDISPFSIHDVVDHVIMLNTGKVRQKQLDIRAEIGDDVPEFVDGDPVRLTQILMNLVTNAIKFTPQGRVSVLVSGKRTDDDATLITFRVSDTGIGIDSENLDRIFERFEQATTDTTREFGGTGLGLSIVKMLVELHNGSIVVDSEIGRGTEFSVRIPYAISKDRPRRPSKGEGIWKRGLLGNIRILLAEDNEMNQKLVEQFISRNGGRIDVAVNGSIAVKKLKAGEYDAVIMDLQMPVMDGYTATRKIRQELRSEIPIIACTAHSLVGEKRRCLKEGMNGYISKPYSERDLVEAILDALPAAADPAGASGEAAEKESKSPSEQLELELAYMERKEGVDFVMSLMEIYNRRTPKDIEKLEKALKEEDSGTIRETAHLIAGSLTTLNFRPGYKIARELESAAGEAYSGKVTEQCRRLIDFLKESLNVTRSYSNN